MSNYGVKRVEKYKKKDVKGIQDEANRLFEDKTKYKNQVDLSRTHLNHYFIRSDDWQKDIDEVVDKYNIKLQKNSTVIIGTIYGVSPEWLNTHSEAEAMQYFTDCYEDAKQHGKVINAVLQKDETNWHLQVATIPLHETTNICKVSTPLKDKNGNQIYQKDETGEYKKDENDELIPEVVRYKTGKSKGKIKYKKVKEVDENGNEVKHWSFNASTILGNEKQMSLMQSKFHKDVSSKYGLERGEIRFGNDNAEKKKHLDELDFRIKKEQEKIEEKNAIMGDFGVFGAKKKRKYYEDTKAELDNRALELQKRDEQQNTRENDLNVLQRGLTARSDELDKREEAINQDKKNFDKLVDDKVNEKSKKYVNSATFKQKHNNLVNKEATKIYNAKQKDFITKVDKMERSKIDNELNQTTIINILQGKGYAYCDEVVKILGDYFMEKRKESMRRIENEVFEMEQKSRKEKSQQYEPK